MTGMTEEKQRENATHYKQCAGRAEPLPLSGKSKLYCPGQGDIAYSTLSWLTVGSPSERRGSGDPTIEECERLAAMTGIVEIGIQVDNTPAIWLHSARGQEASSGDRHKRSTNLI